MTSGTGATVGACGSSPTVESAAPVSDTVSCACAIVVAVFFFFGYPPRISVQVRPPFFRLLTVVGVFDFESLAFAVATDSCNEMPTLNPREPTARAAVRTGFPVVEEGPLVFEVVPAMPAPESAADFGLVVVRT